MSREKIVSLDKKRVWHPYTAMDDYRERVDPIGVGQFVGGLFLEITPENNRTPVANLRPRIISVTLAELAGALRLNPRCWVPRFRKTLADSTSWNRRSRRTSARWERSGSIGAPLPGHASRPRSSPPRSHPCA